MSKKETKSSQILIYAVSLSVIVIGIAIAYYFAIALPKIQSDKQFLETQKFELQKSAQDKEEQNSKNYQTCRDSANESARELLKSKIEIADKSGTSVPSSWREAVNKGLMLKEDYNSYYDSCIKSYGLK